jgi:uncharacterized flavoprotein (TIGR03862 family)
MATPVASVVGAGPAGLMAAETLAEAGVSVTVYDRMPSAGRKFLLAGRGGLNLTHSEDLPHFLGHYRGLDAPLERAIEAFPPAELRAWCERLGQTTFVGSSGRVFPKSMKASPLLRAWLGRLNGLGVRWKLSHRWLGWDSAGQLKFETEGETIGVTSDVTVFALGGGSWGKLGSDGRWTSRFVEEGIGVADLKPSNCGFVADFPEGFRERHQGSPLKGIGLRFEGRSVRGEAVITRTGLEGGAVYALSAALREAIEKNGAALLHVDLRPGVEEEGLAEALSRPRHKQSTATFLRKALRLSPASIGLLHEVSLKQGGALASKNAAEVAALIKNVPVRLTGTASIDRSISSAGGVRFSEIDGAFMLKKRPGTFVAGEMLDWEAPTGGYLLQACFSTGAAAGRGALDYLARRS